MEKDYDDGLDLSGIDDGLDLSEIDDGLDLSGIEDETEVEGEAPSMLESAGRGAVQGATLGWGEELASGLMAGPSMLYKNVAENIQGTPEFTDARLREQGFTGDIGRDSGSSDLLENYRSLRDTGAGANKAAREENPIAYGAGEFAGAIAPTIALGGGNIAAGGIGKVVARGALQGAAEGAVVGAGISEADLTKGEVGQFSEDVRDGAVIGGAGGAVLPVAMKGAGKVLKGTGGLIKDVAEGTADVLGFKKPITMAYELAKKGISLTKESVEKEMAIYSRDILDTMKTYMKKSGLSKKEIAEELDMMGIRINAGEPIDIIQADLKKVVSKEGKTSKDKLINALEEYKSNGTTKASKLLEKKRAQQVSKLERQGIDLKHSTDFEQQYDELLPLAENKGKVIGTEDLYTTPKGVNKKVINTTAVEGSDVPIEGFEDLSSLSLADFDVLLKDITDKSGDLSRPGNPVETKMRKLALLLKEARNKQLEGDPRYLDNINSQRKLYEGAQIAPVDNNFKFVKSEESMELGSDKLNKFLGRDDRGSYIDQNRFFQRLEESGIRGIDEIKKEGDILRAGKDLYNKSESGSILRVTREAAATITNYARRKATPVIDVTKKIMSIPPATLSALAKRSPSVAKFGNVIQKLIDDPSKADVIMWTLSRQPAFRKAIQDALKDKEENGNP